MRYVGKSVASNRAHVTDFTARGFYAEEDREDHIVRLYEGQLAALQREFVEVRNRANDAMAKLREAGLG